MHEDWLKKIDKFLETSLDEFLASNHYQNQIWNDQINKDKELEICNEYLNLIKQASSYREKIIYIAREIKDWNKRRKKTSDANEKDLENKVNKHIDNLMKAGREYWEILNQIKLELIKKDTELRNNPNIQNKDSKSKNYEFRNSLIEEELNILRRKFNKN
tara:strand:- start:583 stop:1062 length:480 start_codon:yes stop_codon:yes gene_type:complete